MRSFNFHVNWKERERFSTLAFKTAGRERSTAWPEKKRKIPDIDWFTRSMRPSQERLWIRGWRKWCTWIKYRCTSSTASAMPGSRHSKSKENVRGDYRIVEPYADIRLQWVAEPNTRSAEFLPTPRNKRPWTLQQAPVQCKKVAMIRGTPYWSPRHADAKGVR